MVNEEWAPAFAGETNEKAGVTKGEGRRDEGEGQSAPVSDLDFVRIVPRAIEFHLT